MCACAFVIARAAEPPALLARVAAVQMSTLTLLLLWTDLLASGASSKMAAQSPFSWGSHHRSKVSAALWPTATQWPHTRMLLLLTARQWHSRMALSARCRHAHTWPCCMVHGAWRCHCYHLEEEIPAHHMHHHIHHAAPCPLPPPPTLLRCCCCRPSVGAHSTHFRAV